MGGGGVPGYTKKMENGWMCLEKCVETINGYLSKWIWLGCMGLLVVMGGGGGGLATQRGWMTGGCAQRSV